MAAPALRWRASAGWLARPLPKPKLGGGRNSLHTRNLEPQVEDGPLAWNLPVTLGIQDEMKRGVILDRLNGNSHGFPQQGTLGGDCASVTAAEIDTSHERLKAEGFPLAPLIEAVMAVQFEAGISPDEAQQIGQALSESYSIVAETKEHGFIYDADAETVELQERRSIYRLEGSDETEVAQVRPEGLAVSQLAPYKCWELLTERFGRDWFTAEKIIGERKPSRLSVRYINRIDVPLVGGKAPYEEYLAVHVRLPDSIPSIEDFYLRFGLAVPEVHAAAIIQCAVMPPAIEGKMSFALDIDLSRSTDLPPNREGVLALLNEFREAKNKLYSQFLTPKALEEFK